MLAFREIGTGRPLVLLHGFAGDGTLWERPAATFAEHGFRVIMPDFRGHGRSPADGDFPPDVLTDDVLELVEHLGLDDYDLGGYSLGARIVVRMLVRGATPGRAIVAGQGLREVEGTGGGAGAAFRQLAESGADIPFLRGKDPAALLRALDSIVDTPAEALKTVTTPTLVVLGADDERAASGDELVAVLPNATRAVIPGNHGTAATAAELTETMLAFLRSGTPHRAAH